MAEIESIAPSNLQLDAENPRLDKANQGQRETLRALATEQKRKLVLLAKDIVEHGLNPSDLPIVTPHGTDRSKYTVLEGNRRIAALKALEAPDTLVGAIDAGLLLKLRELSKQYLSDPEDLISCLVVKNASEAAHWIKLRHTGENEGIGIVQWGSQESSRFDARTGGVAQPEIQVLDFLEKEHYLTAAERAAVPATSLRRLIGTPAVRQKVGITLEKGSVHVMADRKKVGKALAWVAKDLSSGATKTDDIYTADKRAAYANKLPPSVAVAPTKAKGTKIGESSDGAVKKASAKKVRKLKPRAKLIPPDCVLHVVGDRMKLIEHELRTMAIEDYPNAIAVLFRVFFELSVDHYLDNNAVSGVTVRDKLIVKTQKVTEDLVKRKKLDDQQAKPVRKACIKNSYLAPSIPVMHEYVHNEWAFPQPGDLRAYWSNLQPFFAAIWSV